MITDHRSTAVADFQPELNLRMKASKAITRDAVQELCGLLRGRGWVTARALRQWRPEWSERHIRALASASGSVISGPGTPGYILAGEIADDELRHAGKSNIAQGREMARRGIRFLRLLALRRKAAELTHSTTHR